MRLKAMKRNGRGKSMKTLHMDALTASIALVDLERNGSDLKVLAQALDEDWRRFAVDPRTGTRHLVTTMRTRQNVPPTGLTYTHTALIRPNPVRAEDRPLSERWLKGSPFLCAEIAREDQDYRLSTAMLRITVDMHAVIDRDRARTVFYLSEGSLPDVVMMAATGRRLSQIVDVGACGDMIVEQVRTAGADEMKMVLGQDWREGIAIETALPEWIGIDFEPVYRT